MALLMSRPVRTLICAVALCPLLSAQDDLKKKESDLDKAAAAMLASFARTAAGQKVMTRQSTNGPKENLTVSSN